MLKVIASNSFKHDLKLAMRRGLNISLLGEVATKLSNGESLPERYRDHNLMGEYSGFRECHIEPDYRDKLSAPVPEYYCDLRAWIL